MSLVTQPDRNAAKNQDRIPAGRAPYASMVRPVCDQLDGDYPCDLFRVSRLRLYYGA